MPRDVTRVNVDGDLIGIVGLSRAMEELADKLPEGPDDVIKSELISMVSRENFIPETSRESYGESLLLEFMKFTGKAVDGNAPTCLEIKVLGPGCVQCNRLKRDLIDVLSETAIKAAVDHVKDLREISEHGVMGTPALVINGKVMSVGSVPPKARLKEWIQKSAASI